MKERVLSAFGRMLSGKTFKVYGNPEDSAEYSKVYIEKLYRIYPRSDSHHAVE